MGYPSAAEIPLLATGSRYLNWGLLLDHIPHLKEHFAALGIPADASDWLCGVWGAFQFYDDLADGDEITRADVDRELWSGMVTMPSNPFFMARCQTLLPVLALQILKWQASDHAERNGAADARSYVWRAGFYDIVLMVTHLCGGADAAKSRAVLSLYGETLAEYLEEFPNA
tara:strand:+ start:8792 stop:9304 length:513 start_codon:yes stop_codon:yes gene_type:complete